MVRRVLLDHRVHRDLKVIQDPKALRVPLEHREHKVLKGIKVKRVTRELLLTRLILLLLMNHCRYE